MIEGFEDYTHRLTFDEIAWAHEICEKICQNVGKNNTVTNKKIQQHFKDKGVTITPARVRKILHWIRVNHKVKRLVAGGKGYYVTNSSGSCLAISRHYASELTARSVSMQH